MHPNACFEEKSMKFFWRILNRLLGKYMANILIVLITFTVLWLGLSYYFQLNKAMSNQEIIALMNIPDSISSDILEDQCYSMIDANGCNLTLGYSTKERNAINIL